MAFLTTWDSNPQPITKPYTLERTKVKLCIFYDKSMILSWRAKMEALLLLSMVILEKLYNFPRKTSLHSHISDSWMISMALMLSKPKNSMFPACLSQLSKHEGPPEGFSEHLELQQKSRFSYRTLLGKMMFAYVSCQADIKYAITLMSVYSSKPSAFHYKCLKVIEKYPHTT